MNWRPLLVVVISASALLAPSPTNAQVAGGWSKAAVADPQVAAAARFAVAAQQQALKAAGDPAKLSLVKIVGAEQQVVSGMNYKLMLEVKSGETLRTAEAQVWTRLWLKEKERRQLTSWKFVEGEPKPPQ